jgi:uncharacterized protein (TIRG00374 family)
VTRTLRTAAMVAGVAILGFLTYSVGFETLLRGIRLVGWMAIPIVLLHAVVYALNAVAWWLTLSHEPGAPPFRTIFRISLAGFAINFLTPIVNAGGEPYRMAALAPWIGPRRAAGSVLQYAMLHALSSLLMWLTAIAAALTLSTVTGSIRLSLIGAGSILVAALIVVQLGHRHGFVARTAAWIARRPLGRVSVWLTGRAEAFASVDAQLATMHSEHPARLALAVAVDYFSRWVAMGELLLVAKGLGLSVSVLSAVMISGLSALAVNVFFLLPWEMGSREGSLFLLFGLAGVPASVGMIAAILTRLREIIWCGIGLAVAGRANIPRSTPPA